MYKEYKSSIYWNIVSEGLNELKKNDDIEYHTDKNHIVGYLVKKLHKSININSGNDKIF